MKITKAEAEEILADPLEKNKTMKDLCTNHLSMLDALEFYGDKENYKKCGGIFAIKNSPVTRDRGAKARAVTG